jgi:hypothetical protein
MTDTTIYINDFPIHEPVTVLTDYIITLLCLLFFFRLKNENKVVSQKYWKAFFLFFGVSTFVGGFSHALFAIHEGFVYKSFWITMQVLNGFAVYSAQQATYNTVLQNNEKREVWKKSYIIQLVLFLIAVFVFQNFLVVVLDNAIGLIPVMVLHFMDSKNPRVSKLIANGILISFLTAFVHGAKLSLGAYFNFNDISHVLIMLSLFVVFLGVSKNSDLKSNS